MQPDPELNRAGADPEDGARSVTVSIARTVLPGREEDYESWLQSVTAKALTFPGHMGVNVIKPLRGSREYISIFRFDTYEHLRNWEDSAQRAAWLEKLEGIVENKERVQKGTGLEFWFSLPDLPVSHPSPHRMAMVLIVVVFSLVVAINLILAPYKATIPPLAATFIGVVIQVVAMTYLVMPRVTRLLKGWLYT